MVKEPTAGHDEQRSGGLHSTSEPRQHADQDLPPNHWQHSRNSWPATRARESGSHAGSIKKRREKYRETKSRTSRMIAASITRAGKNLAPRGLKSRNSRIHGAKCAGCAVPRRGAPGRGSLSGRSLSARFPRRRSPSFFRRAAARTCPRAVSLRPGRACAAVALVAPAARAFPLPAAHFAGGISATARAARPACGESDTICVEYGHALEGPPALTLPGPTFSPGGLSGLSGPAGDRHRASGKNEIRCLGPLRSGPRHGRRPC